MSLEQGFPAVSYEKESAMPLVLLSFKYTSIGDSRNTRGRCSLFYNLLKTEPQKSRAMFAYRAAFKIFVARRTGIEPVTHSLEGCCSIQLS
jgi:hypothetical protein